MQPSFQKQSLGYFTASALEQRLRGRGRCYNLVNGSRRLVPVAWVAWRAGSPQSPQTDFLEPYGCQRMLEVHVLRG